MTTVHTPRLVLRPATLDDLDDWFALDRQPGVLAHLGGRTPSREQVARDLRARLVVARLHHGFGWFSILLDGAFIGRCSVRPSAGGNIFDAEIGHRLRTEHWRQGLITEAAGTLVEYAFAELGVHSVIDVTAARDESAHLRHRITLDEWFTTRDDVRQQLHDLQARALAARDGEALDRLRAAGMELAAIERPGHWASSALVRQIAGRHQIALG